MTQGRPTGLPVAAQFALCLAFVQWHAFARSLVAGSREEAIGHGDAVIGRGRAVGLYVERAIQRLALQEPLLGHLPRARVLDGHIVAPAAALAFLWRRD